MKLTKQESAMVKLAAAWMAPQMIKKATLQDKLAAYGIGLTKQAADADGKWTAPALPTAGIAQAARPRYWPEMTAGERLTFALNRPERIARQLAARGAINEIKTNGWPNVGMGPYSLAQIQAKSQPIYGNRLFQNLANLAKSPEDLNDSIVKMNREGVAPDTRRSDSTGLMPGNGRALPRILAPGSTLGR